MGGAANQEPAPARIGGLSLPQYAAVKAAVAEGFPVAEVLAIEGVSERVFGRADPAWKLRIVDDPSIFRAYEEELARAQDWLDRAVPPLDADPAAWAAFLEAMAADAAGMLARAGLSANDVARLHRRWERRVADDPALAGRIADLRKKAAPAPGIAAAPRVLRPSRFARRRPEAPPPEAPRDAGPRAEPEISLDRYAALCAEIAAYPNDRARVLARFGLSGDEALEATDRAFHAAMLDDAQMAADFRRLLNHNRARLASPARDEGAAKPAPPAPPAPPTPPRPDNPRPVSRAPLDSTAPMLDVRLKQALPFAKRIATGAHPLARVVKTPPARRDGPLTGTGTALPIPRGEALPFRARPAALDTTAPAFESPAPALPFAAGSAPVPAQPAKPVSAAPPRSPAVRDATAPDAGPLPIPVLPFPSKPEPKKGNKLQDLSFSLAIPRGLIPTSLSTSPSPAPAAPSPAPAAPSPAPAAPSPAPAAPPSITIEQYASLCVELAMRPESAAETLARYRMTAADKQVWDRYWSARTAADPAVRAAWESAYRRYWEWLVSAGRAGR